MTNREEQIQTRLAQIEREIVAIGGQMTPIPRADPLAEFDRQRELSYDRGMLNNEADKLRREWRQLRQKVR